MGITYNAFNLLNFAIANTRSVHEDTDYVGLAISQNDNPVSTATKKVGNVNNGTHSVNLTVDIADAYNDNDQFVLSYLVLNHGGGAEQDVLNDCKAALTQFQWNKFSAYDAQIETSNGRQLPLCMVNELRGANMQVWWNEMKPAFQHVTSDHCDGPVAIDSLSFTGQSLSQILLWSNQKQPFSFVYEGIDSAIGCGSNSRYSVEWYASVDQIERVPPLPR